MVVWRIVELWWVLSGYVCNNFFQKDRWFGDKERAVRVMVGTGWLYSLALALPPLLGWGSFAPETNGMR